ncbi:hypothetical protein ACTXT7_010104 [Hymenolepis weldensis]
MSRNDFRDFRYHAMHSSDKLGHYYSVYLMHPVFKGDQTKARILVLKQKMLFPMRLSNILLIAIVIRIEHEEIVATIYNADIPARRGKNQVFVAMAKA